MDFCSVYLDVYVSNVGCLLPELDTKGFTEKSNNICLSH